MLTRLTKVRNSGVDDKKILLMMTKNVLIMITKDVPIKMKQVRGTKKCPGGGFKSHLFG